MVTQKLGDVTAGKKGRVMRTSVVLSRGVQSPPSSLGTGKGGSSKL
jgi:hypothetical protein